MGCCGRGRAPASPIIRGAIGLTKVALGIGRAPSWTVGLRSPICAACSERKGAFCSVCKCLVHAKVQLLEEKCPRGKW